MAVIALHYRRKDGGREETPPAVNTIRFVEDGPPYVRGTVAVVSSEEHALLEDTRVALCRCGLSENKPFCDGSHGGIRFRAP